MSAASSSPSSSARAAWAAPTSSWPRPWSRRPARHCRVTIAGGVTTAEEIRALDELGADAQVGMALYTGRLDLADAIMAPLVTRPAGRALAHGRRRRARHRARARLLVAANRSARRCGAGWASTSRARAACGSRARPAGADAGAAPHRPRLRPRQPALRRPPAAAPGFCHLDTRTCWGEDAGLGHLARTLAGPPQHRRPRAATPPSCSPIRTCSAAKLREEAGELAEATDREHVIWEAADVLYFTLARLAARGHRPRRGRGHLDRRALKVTRRG